MGSALKYVRLLAFFRSQFFADKNSYIPEQNNPFDYFTIKVNFSEDPQASVKKGILLSHGLDGLKHFILRDNIPADLLRQLRVVLMNRTELDRHLTGPPSPNLVDFVCYR